VTRRDMVTSWTATICVGDRRGEQPEP
jgi:hypothetical protein